MTRLCCAFLLLAPLCLVNAPQVSSQPTVHAQAIDDKLKANFRQLARQMSDLAERLDNAAAISERASGIVNQSGASGAATEPAPATAAGGTATPSLTGEATMAALQQLVARRRDVLAQTQSLSAKLSGPQRASAASRAAERSPSAKAGASLEALKALSADLKTADFRSDVQAAQATLDASRKAAQDAARAALSKASRETIDRDVPKRISAMVAPAAGARANFSSMSVEDHLNLIFVLSADDAREELKAVMQSTASANQRLYQAATKAQSAIDRARLGLLLAVADTQLAARSALRPRGDDIASSLDYLIKSAGMQKPDPTEDKLKKLAAELDALKKQKRDITQEILDLEPVTLQVEADCASAVAAAAAAKAQAQQAAAAAGAGALIGGTFGGPLGAAFGAAIGAAAAGGLPENIPENESCKRLGELSQRVDVLQNQLAQLESRIKTVKHAIEEIRRAEQEALDRGKDDRSGSRIVVTRPSAPRLKASDAAATPSPKIKSSSGSDRSRSDTPARSGNAAMDRLTGDGMGPSVSTNPRFPDGNRPQPGRGGPSGGGSSGISTSKPIPQPSGGGSSGISTSRPIDQPSGGGSSGISTSRQP